MTRRLLRRLLRATPALRRFRRDREGSAAVEFAMVALPFFALLFAILETGLVFMAGQVLDNATQNAARLVLTGQMKSSVTNVDDFKTEVCKSLPALITCAGISMDVRSFGTNSPTAQPSPIVNGVFDKSSFGFNTGAAGDIVLVRLFYEWPLVVTGLGYNIANVSGNKRLLSTTLAFRNEPF
jgi:Flp pilus assembly protein TadG